MIPNSIIEDIKSRLDIVDVVGDFVSLKKSGQNYKSLSPFSNEKTASFYVVPSKGIFKDFSSGKGGDAITFVMEHEKLGYTEALKYLAKKYGIEIKEDPRWQKDEQNERDSLYIVMARAKDYFHDLLFNNNEGKSIGAPYFKERLISPDSIKKFELGYSLDEWHGLEKAFTSNGFSKELLEKAGLIINKDKKTYDRFRGRVIFPVHNLSGKIVAFGARVLGKSHDQAKYINSPETEIYHKSHELYGLYHSRNAIRKSDECFLVEGYTDVISMHQAGIENTVASSGTSLTVEQIRLIKRFTHNLTIVYDGDVAGVKAAIRGIDLALKEGLNVNVVLLPEGEDPDSFAKKKRGHFLEFISKEKQGFIGFKANLLAKDTESDPVKKAAAIHEMIDSISCIQDPLKRSLLIKDVSIKMGVDEMLLITELNKRSVNERIYSKGKESALKQAKDILTDEIIKASPLSMVELQEREIIGMLLRQAESFIEEERKLIDFMIVELEDVEFVKPAYKEIFSIYTSAWHDGQVPSSLYLMELGNEEIKQIVTELLVDTNEVSAHWTKELEVTELMKQEAVSSEAMEKVLKLKLRVVQNMINENAKSMKGLPDGAQLDNHIHIHQKLKEVESSLADTLGITILPGN